jgi:hypothetical protein
MEDILPDDQLRISFNIDAYKYAEDCNFNKEVAEYLLHELKTCRSPVYPELILTRFVDKVLNICMEETERLREESKAARREGFVRVFLTRPCRICGSEDHHMLREEQQEDGTITKHFNCPIAAYSDEDLQRGLPGTKMYKICPIKLAEISGYSHEGVNDNLTRILETGHGRFLSNDRIFRLRDLAYRSCDQEREKWGFKREQIPVEEGESEDEGEQT